MTQAILFDNKSDMEMKICQVAIDDLEPAEENPRTLDLANRAQLKESLERFGWINPVIVNRITGRILTGHQRTLIAKEDLGWDYCPVTYVSVKPEEELQAVVRLNEASGQWYFKVRDKMQNQHYAQLGRRNLGSGYKGWVLGDEPYKQTDKKHQEIVKEALGDVIVDYGAGRMAEFSLLHKLGIQTIGYDPYQKAPKEKKSDLFRPTIEHTRALASKFFQNLLDLQGKPFTTVNQTVLNCIPFREVREQVAIIVAGLTYIGWPNPLYCSIMATTAEAYESFLYGRVKNTTGKTKSGREKPQAAPARHLYIPDESEPNVIASGVGTTRQVIQKYWTPEEVDQLFSQLFTEYEMKHLRMVHCIRAYNDEQPDMELLHDALWEQFEKLEINGTPIGMGDLAIETFDKLIETQNYAIRAKAAA